MLKVDGRKGKALEGCVIIVSSNRQHYHINDCLEDNREDY